MKINILKLNFKLNNWAGSLKMGIIQTMIVLVLLSIAVGNIRGASKKSAFESMLRYIEVKAITVNNWVFEIFDGTSDNRLVNGLSVKKEISNLFKTLQLIFMLSVSIIFLLFASFIFHLNFKRLKQNERQLLKKIEDLNEIKIQKEFAMVKLMTLRAQMNPHFIFNTIQAIQSYIVSEKSQQAYDYLLKFSKLLRLVMLKPETIMSKLSDEVEFINLYLALEKLRYGDKFNYIVNFPSNLTQEDITIPSMIIQPHVENAIIHGLVNKTRNGMVVVSFSIANEKLMVVIDDNGVGRKKASEISRKKMPNAHNKIAQKNIFTRLVKLGEVKRKDYRIIDKYDKKGNALGTKVVIKIRIN